MRLSFPVLTISALMLLCGASESSQATETQPGQALAASSHAETYSARIAQLLALTPDSITSEQTAVSTFEKLNRAAHESVQLEDLETSLKLAEQATALFPEQLRSSLLLGWVQGMSGKPDQGVEMTRKALEQKTDRLPDPEGLYRAEALTNIGGFLLQLKRPEEAAKHLEQARETNPEAALPVFLLGEAYHELKEVEPARKAYKRAFAMDETLASPSDYIMYAWAEDSGGDIEEAGKIISRGISRFPVANGLHLNLGLNREAQSATTEAFYEYQMELLVSDKGPYADAARKRIERIERTSVAAGSGREGLRAVLEYLAWRRDKDPERAEKSILRAVEFNNLRHPYPSYLHAEMLAASGQHAEAARVLEEASKEHPNEVLLQIDLAAEYGKSGQKEKSEQLLSRLMLVAPDHWKLQQLIGPK